MSKDKVNTGKLFATVNGINTAIEEHILTDLDPCLKSLAFTFFYHFEKEVISFIDNAIETQIMSNSTKDFFLKVRKRCENVQSSLENSYNEVKKLVLN